MQKLLIALIHNEEAVRLKYLNNEIELIKLRLQRWGYLPRIIKIGGGGYKRKNHSKHAILRRMVINETYVIKNLDLRGADRILQICRIFKKILKVMCRNYLLPSSKEISNAFRKIQIEDEVSRKHLLVLEKFSNSEEDYLIVFESDSLVINREEFCLEIHETIQRAESKTISLFNSHFPLDELNILSKNLKLIRSKHMSNLKYEAPFLATNTLCSYGMAKNIASIFLEKCKENTKNPLPPADWMFDQAFKEISFAFPHEYKTIFFYPSLVENGSLKGRYTSGIQEV